MSPQLLSIVIPCYNEEEVITLTHSRLLEVSETVGQRLDLSVEIVYIDDGSSDSTLSLLQGLADNTNGRGAGARQTKVRVVCLSRNFGHQSAMAAGLFHAQGDYVVTIDADLQDPPELILEMVEKAQKGGFDVVHGRRLQREGESAFKKVTAFLFYRVLRTLSSGKSLTDVGDFRLLSRRVTNAVNALPERSLYLRGLLPELGFPQSFVLYDRPERAAGETKYTLRKMVALALEGLTAVSTAPLRLGLSLGFVTAAVSLIYLFWILFRELTDPNFAVRGWPSLMVTVLFLGAIQLFSIGVLGEYIGQIHKQVRNRPRFFVDANRSRGLSGENNS